MSYLVKAPRVGRSQGAVIFWGLVSAFFASAFCYYFLKSQTNEANTRALRDQVMSLQTERDSLSSERDKIQSSAAETQKQLKTREDFLQDKETKLAEEETRLESMGQQSQNHSQQNQTQAAGVKKFDDTVRKIVAKTQDADVVVRGGRPVLRVPGSIFFAYGDAQLTADGKTMLRQVMQSLDGQSDRFEFRVDTFTDSGGEVAKTDAPADDKPADKSDDAKKPDATTKPTTPAAAKPSYATSWELTGARAASITHYLRDQGTMPFQNIIVMARGDSQPIVANSKEGHARDRRVEITITPVPPTYRAPAPDSSHKNSSAAKPEAPADPLAPPPDSPAASGN